MANYWSNLLEQRLSRRRSLAATGAAAAGVALLAACGGGSKSNGSGGGSTNAKDKSGLVAQIQDTSKTAKRGGSFKWSQASEPLHFDGGVQGQAQLNVFNGLAYGALVQNKPGYMQPTSNSDVVGDLAESWEFSPDKTTITFKLRQGVKWQNKAPVNGRAFDATDVVMNWQRFISKPGNDAASMAASVNPSAPVLDVSSPDASTVVFKLKSPLSSILQRLGTMVTGEAGTILPREADHGFDPRQDQIGTGGFMLDHYEPSVSLTYKRNPDYWNKQEPYVDSLEIPFIQDYANALAQLKTGAVYAFPVQAQDVVAAKNDTQSLNMYQQITSATNPSAIVGFGWLPIDGQKSPFLDVRVRQALSLSYDRDAFIDTFSNVSSFESQGLPVDVHYYTCQAYVPDVWLDPRGKDFGPNGVYYTQNIAMAKQLMSAAGYANGFDFESKFISGSQFGLDHQKQVQVLDNWARDVGFKSNPRAIDYNLEYLPKIVTQAGKFDGWAYRFGATTSNDPMDFYAWRYWSKSGPTSGQLGFDVKGAGDGSGDPDVDAMIEKGLAEVDSKKRTAIIQDLQRYLAKMQYGVSRPGDATGFTLAWPVVGNAQVFQGDSRGASAGAPGTPYTWWLDDTQAPLKKS